MARKGMGVVYTRTSSGRPLRRPPSAAQRLALLARFYEPHHAALTTAVDRALAAHGTCLVRGGHASRRARCPTRTTRTRTARTSASAPTRATRPRGYATPRRPPSRRWAGAWRSTAPSPARSCRCAIAARTAGCAPSYRGPPRPLHGRTLGRARARVRRGQRAHRAGADSDRFCPVTIAASRVP